MIDGNINPLISIVVLLVASALLLIVGVMMKNLLRSRVAALAWAILTVAPLFGGGFLLFGNHQVQGVSDETRADPGEPAAH